MNNLLLESDLERTLCAWLKEDIPSFDYGGFVVGSTEKKAHIYCKQTGILCGVPFVTHLFTRILGCRIEWSPEWKEGDLITLPSKNGADRVVVATLTGPANKLLQGERLALNLLARASGISTLAHSLLALRSSHAPHWSGRLAGTRKTTPGFRLVEKYALLVGGVDGHRMDLSSMCMLKDNHVWAVGGGVASAVREARRVVGFSGKIEVECRTVQEAREAAESGAEVVMLDNFKPEQVRAAVQVLKSEFPRVCVEVSGGLTRETVSAYMIEGVDVLSMGCLTQGVPHIDFSMKIERESQA